MYIFKNAFTSIRRNKGRNILIGVIIVVIALTSTIALSIRNSATKLVESYENKYNIEATLSFNRKNLVSSFEGGEDKLESNIEKFNSISALSIDEINNYGNSNYVDYYYYTYSVSMNSKTLTVATEQIEKTTTETTTKTTRKEFPGFGPGGKGGSTSTSTTTKKTTEEIANKRLRGGDFTVVGYSSYEGMNDFISGSYTIKEGEVNSDFTANSCVINSELATLNEIKIADTITLVSTNDETLSYDLIVTGIYEDSSDDSTNMMNMYSSSANKIITNVSVVEKMVSDDEKITTTVTPTYILKDKDSVESFTTEVSEKGLNENYEISTNIDTIESETKSITNVKTFATTFLIITLSIGAIVLFVINLINVRERKYEIGVLRTIGMRKSLVTFQFVTELLVVAIMSLLIGFGIGSFASVPTSNMLLEQEISTQKEQSEDIGSNFGRKEQDFKNVNGVAKINEITEINAVVDFKVLLQLLGIGIGLTLLSSLASMISISRFSPITILKERS